MYDFMLLPEERELKKDILYQEDRLGLLLYPAELMAFVKNKIPGPWGC